MVSMVHYGLEIGTIVMTENFIWTMEQHLKGRIAGRQSQRAQTITLFILVPVFGQQNDPCYGLTPLTMQQLHIKYK